MVRRSNRPGWPARNQTGARNRSAYGLSGNLLEENAIAWVDSISRNAVSSGTMWRGLEVILKGRDPRDAWAFTERICGVCTGVHALASVRCVEDALAIKIPDNANIIRNFERDSMQGTVNLLGKIV